MKVESIRVFDGVNYHSHAPAVVAVLDMEGATPTSGPNNIVDRFFKLFPALTEHRCLDGQSLPRERQDGSVDVPDLISHVARELAAQADPERSETHRCLERRIWDKKLVIATRYGEMYRYLIPRAVAIADSLLAGLPPILENILVPAREILLDSQLGPSGQCIVDAAERRGIPWTRENDYSLVQLGYGRNLHWVQAAATDRSSDIGVDIVGNKNETKKRLRKFSIPTPDGMVVETEDEAVRAFESVDFPVVVKPLTGNQGKGVSLGISTADEVRIAFHHAQQFSERVLLEELLSGKNYRVLVVDGKMVAASERRACVVIGDGIATLQELVDRENENPLRGECHEKPLTRINLTPNLIAAIIRDGWSLSDVPPRKTVVQIGDGLNLSTGGTAKDVTDDVHRSVQLLCERAARVVGLDICGIDLMLEDIASPMPQPRGGIIEINAAPGLRMHVHPSEGRSRDVGAAIVKMLYPGQAPSRIPLIAITGTNGKTTVTRMISHILRQTDLTIGTTTTDGILINGESVIFGDTTGPASAKTVLSDSSIDVAVLETARGGILRRGLGWDWADIGVITNVTEDHIGQDGIESVADLIEIKALIAERVRRGGTLVLNADDEGSSEMAYRPEVIDLAHKVVYFSTRKDSFIYEHVDGGGTGYLVLDGWITEVTKDLISRLVNTFEIPCTVDGTSEYQIQNAMAAVAVARAMGMQAAEIGKALKSFQSERDNAGRSNIYRVGKGLAVIDYGHNPMAIEAICNMVSKWGMKSTGIISFPGDRKEEVIETSTIAAARGFDRIIVKGDKNLRGRKEGEVAEMMVRIIADNNGPIDTRIELDAEAAFERAIADIAENEVVVFLYEKLEPVLEILAKYGAVPTESVIPFERNDSQTVRYDPIVTTYLPTEIAVRENV